MNWRALLLAVLFVAALASGWSAWKNRAVKAVPEATAGRPDYLLRDFTVVALDKDGKESVTLRAPEMERNAKDQTMTLRTPVFLMPDAAGNRWTMAAQTGWVSAAADEVRLRGAVKGDSPTTGTTPRTTIRTEAMDLFPNTDLAKAPGAVEFTRPGTIINGSNFVLNTKTQHYQFLSPSRTRYDPSAKAR